MNSDWYIAVLEEYKSLRSEAVTARDAQLSVLRLGVALVAALIGLGVTLRSENFLGGILLSIVVPVFVILTFELWIGEIQRSVRAGAVVAAIEERLANIFRHEGLAPPMGWELWLRSRPHNPSWPDSPRASQQQRDSVIRALVISGFLFFIALGSCILGIHFLWHDKYRAATYITGSVVGIGLVLLVVRAFFAMRGIRHRDAVPSSDELWPAAAALANLPQNVPAL
jgi:hypothetical protein